MEFRACRRWLDSCLRLCVAAVGMLPCRRHRRRLPCRRCIAQGKLDARYTASLAGMPIGRGAWVIDIGDDQYTAAASGMTTGLLSVFASGQGSGAARGHVRATAIWCRTPTPRASPPTRSRGDAGRCSAAAPSRSAAIDAADRRSIPTRMPVTEAHRRGVTDPMSGALDAGRRQRRSARRRRPAGAPSRCSTAACASICKLSFKRMDSREGRQGLSRGRRWSARSSSCRSPAMCRTARRSNIWSRSATWRCGSRRSPGTRIVVPFRFSVPTPFGLGVLEATQFIATPHARLTANSPPIERPVQRRRRAESRCRRRRPDRQIPADRTQLPHDDPSVRIRRRNGRFSSASGGSVDAAVTRCR